MTFLRPSLSQPLLSGGDLCPRQDQGVHELAAAVVHQGRQRPVPSHQVRPHTHTYTRHSIIQSIIQVVSLQSLPIIISHTPTALSLLPPPPSLDARTGLLLLLLL